MDSMEPHGSKRKRSPSETVPARPTAAPTPPADNGTQINYLMKARNDKMILVKGTSDTFGDVLGLIEDYEGVLLRNESLAANLGAKLVGPLLLKSFDKLFEGPIVVLQAAYGTDGSSITWLDVVEFARSKPQEFVLNSDRVCQFFVKQCHVQISEDDYRLVMSGAPERMIPHQPMPEDEASELGTIEILEQRLAMLIKKADLVAGRARQLNYHLKGRKAGIRSRRSAAQAPDQSLTPQGAASFQSINHQSQSHSESRGLHTDLLRQFVTDEKRSGSVPARVKSIRTSSESPHNGFALPPQSTPDPGRRQSHSHIPAHDDGTGGPYRPIMTARVEKLSRGEPIWPPCDRCRRLSIPCAKHLTACAGCTKKHARCGWKDLSVDEVAYLNGMPEAIAVGTNGSGSNSAHGQTPLGHHASLPAVQPRTDASLDPGMREASRPRSTNGVIGTPGGRAEREEVDASDHGRVGDKMLLSDEGMLSQMASAAATATAAAANVHQ